MSTPILLSAIGPKSRSYIKEHLKGVHKESSYQNNDTDVKMFNLYFSREGYIYMPLSFCRKSFGKHNDDNQFGINDANFKGTLFEKQEEYVENASDLLNSEGGALLKLHPGCGKTVMALYLTVQYKLLTLVIIHNQSHYKQWYKSSNKFITPDVWCVGEDEYSVPTSVDIIVCLYTRVASVGEDILSQVGFLIIDECDEFCNKSGIKSILQVRPKYVLCCTATYDRSDGLHKITDYVIGEGNHVEGELLDFDVYRVSTGIQATKVYMKHQYNGKKRRDYSKLIKSLMYNEERNYLIMRLCLRLTEEGSKIIVITNEKKHAKELAESTREFFQSNDIPYTVDYMTGDKKYYEDSDILIVNYQMGGRGFDEESSCDTFTGIRIDTVIMACSFKSNTVIYQCIGRAFRYRSPQVFQLVDNDSIVQSHWFKNRKWYIENGGIVHQYSMKWLLKN